MVTVINPKTKDLRNKGERKVRGLEKYRNKCQEKISPEEQQQMFDDYWHLGSYQLRQTFVLELIEMHGTKTERKNKSETKPRKRTHYYQLFKKVMAKGFQCAKNVLIHTL